MISLLLKNYSDKEKAKLHYLLYFALVELTNYSCHNDCPECQYRKICKDLKSAIDYTESKLHK